MNTTPPAGDNQPPGNATNESERWELLHTISDILDRPMIALAIVWLILLIVDFTSGLSPLLSLLTDVIWILFILHFLLEFVIAPSKGVYMRRNWLTAVSLAIPALRIFRIFQALRILRAARVARSISMVRLLSSLNRGMRALRNTFTRRGFGYAVALTVIVVLAGAAGMLQFESPQSLRDAGEEVPAQTGTGIHTYGEAVWWTAMLITTIGSEYWPVSPEGRLLAWLLAFYGLAVFSYITATIASHFISQDASDEESLAQRAATAQDAELLREEVQALRSQMAILITRLESQPSTRSGEE